MREQGGAAQSAMKTAVSSLEKMAKAEDLAMLADPSVSEWVEGLALPPDAAIRSGETEMLALDAVESALISAPNAPDMSDDGPQTHEVFILGTHLSGDGRWYAAGVIQPVGTGEVVPRPWDADMEMIIQSP